MLTAYIKHLEDSFENEIETFDGQYNCKLHSDTVPDNLEVLSFCELFSGTRPRERAIAFLWNSTEYLHIGAVMEDSDTYSDAQGVNDKTWAKGDVLELFLQPKEEKFYFEIHVAPNMATLELSIPDAEGLRDEKYSFGDLIFDSGFIPKTETFRSDSGISGWWAYMQLPMDKMDMSSSALSGTKFCICRYNYNRHWGKEPEISSTALFHGDIKSFHQPEFWHEIA